MLATEWGLGNVIWAMIVFFFWVMFIWMFIAVFADIFRRDDIGGGAKAGWILLIVILPFLGILIYVIARPRIAMGSGGADRYPSDMGPGAPDGPRMS